jgi:hypothetical protein
MEFQKTIIVIAVIILIICLIYFWFNISKSSSKTWPPIVGDCPDYWIDLGGNGSKCVNVHNLGTCNNPGKLYKTFVNTSSPGNDLTTYLNVSNNDCKAACMVNSSCNGFVYSNPKRSCTLKNMGIINAEKIPNNNTNLYMKYKKPSTNSVDFSVAPYIGQGATCAKYSWAKNCGVSWDGITYGIDNPCQS